jgi:hypothetical protein
VIFERTDGSFSFVGTLCVGRDIFNGDVCLIFDVARQLGRSLIVHADDVDITILLREMLDNLTDSNNVCGR